ncbi:Eco57I restriction-modification methylase domain-containing protein [Micromonospora sp. NPDC005194]|uniref:Eco57I restriction-modification methylase domain-containing protein n=1 Tax=Micromonospora sp. NPDC005194 TaxID=3156870 RepID=UPI0033AD299A
MARDLGPRGSRDEVGGPDPAADLPLAALQVLAAVPGWWRTRVAAVGLHEPWQSIDYALDLPSPPSLQLVEPDACVTPSLSPEGLGSAYVAALSSGVRARHGRHYTPPALATNLWDMTRRALGHRVPARPLPGLVRDPACGAGALLLPPLREHLAALNRSDPQIAMAGVPNVIEGIDTDPAAVWLANVVLAAEMLPLLAAIPPRRRRPLPSLARVGDGLSLSGQPVRALIMNPPYGRVKLTPEDRARFAHVLYGHANLYGLFMAAALDALDDVGVLAALVPTSFTSGLYFRNLRAAFSSKAPLREAAFVVERGDVFAGVLQETCLAVFTRRKPRHTALFSINGRVSPVARVKAPRGEGPWLLPRRSDDAPVAAAAIDMPLSLGAAGWKASTGPLVWNRRKHSLGPVPGSGRAHVIWAADIDGGKLHQDGVRDSLRYLSLTEPTDEAVLLLKQPAILVQRTTAPEQARRLVLVSLGREDLDRYGGCVVVENHVNVLRPNVDDPLISRRTLARVLSTPTLDRVMRCLSGSVAVSAYELESLPLPGRPQLHQWEEATDVELERLVAAAYRPVISGDLQAPSGP